MTTGLALVAEGGHVLAASRNGIGHFPTTSLPIRLRGLQSVQQTRVVSSISMTGCSRYRIPSG